MSISLRPWRRDRYPQVDVHARLAPFTQQVLDVTARETPAFRRTHLPVSARSVSLLTCLGLTAAGALLGVTSDSPASGGPTQPPEPVPTCVRVVTDATGEADWYCGETIRVPRGAHVIASDIAPCAEEDGSGGPLPCYWDAPTRGRHHGGDSFTILPAGDPVGGLRPVLFRYNNGVTRLGYETR